MEVAFGRQRVVRSIASNASVVGTRCLARHEQRLELFAVLGEVCAADDARGASELAVVAGCKLRRDALHKLHLAQRRHPGRIGGGREKGVRRDEDAVRDVVPAAHAVVDQLVRHVVLLLHDAEEVEALELTHVPQVVVRIDNLELGFDGVLLREVDPRGERHTVDCPGLALPQQRRHAFPHGALRRRLQRLHHFGLLSGRECGERFA
mmetsp:Transcript_25301/g.67812  ORF Transcript_25301/g.67812 Transcript_25301/m.67812 type:complete len:207 (+) Transcript_25301:776-1396(+)|eukprot:1645139-Prymnesium_polylepis.1